MEEEEEGGGDSLVGSSKPRANAGVVAVDRWIWGGQSVMA